MEKKLKFYKDIGKYDDTIYTVSENDSLNIVLQVDTGRSVDYYAIIQHENGQKASLKVKDKTFNISTDMLTYGAIDVTITAKVGNEVVKTVFCEKLIIKELEGATRVVPEINQLHHELNELKALVVTFQENISNQLDKFDKCIKSALIGE